MTGLLKKTLGAGLCPVPPPLVPPAPEGAGHIARVPEHKGTLDLIFQSQLAQKFSIKVRFKYFNQGLVDPDLFFKRDHDRDCLFSSKVRFIFFNQDPIKKIKSRSDFKISIESRFLFFNQGLLKKIKSRSDFKISIKVRFIF
jgi:hypothetical protein